MTDYGYLLLTRSKTVVSKVIHILKGAEYTHASIIYDDAITSVTRLDRRFLFPAGWAEEYFEFGSGIPYALYKCPIVTIPNTWEGNKYDVLRLFGWKHRIGHLVCTDYAHVVITGRIPEKHVLPIELTTLPGVELISKGSFKSFGGGSSYVHSSTSQLYGSENAG